LIFFYFSRILPTEPLPFLLLVTSPIVKLKIHSTVFDTQKTTNIEVISLILQYMIFYILTRDKTKETFLIFCGKKTGNSPTLLPSFPTEDKHAEFYQKHEQISQRNKNDPSCNWCGHCDCGLNELLLCPDFHRQHENL
jgi:hypothetical protein